MRSYRLVPALGLAALLALGDAAAQMVQAPAQPVEPAPRRVVKGGFGRAAQPLSDAEALKKANLSETDGAKLVEYLQQRTLTETEQGRIAEIIKRFGVDDFEERVRATEEVEAFGPAAIGPLKTAARGPD